MVGKAGRSGRKTASAEKSQRPAKLVQAARATAKQMRAPTELGKVGKREWKAAVEHMDHTGMLAVCDRAALLAYASAWDVWEQCRRQIETEGPTIIRLGVCKSHPAITVQSLAINTIKHYHRQFGMTPHARAGLKTVVAPTEQPKVAGAPLTTLDILKLRNDNAVG